MIVRRKEQKELNDAFYDKRSQFAAVYGRRRMGRTFGVKETFDGRFSFRHTGLANADKKQQIAAFKKSQKKAGMRDSSPIADWCAAFDRLEELVEAMPEGRKVIFWDEVPWMDTGCCEFVSALEHFWNCWADYRKDVLLIIRGAATSWMIDGIERGGLRRHGAAQRGLR